MRFALGVVVAVLAVGCVTPYGPSGFMGGYLDRQLGPDRFQIEVSGNAYTSKWTLEDYFHRRARELCVAHGFAEYVFNREVSYENYEGPSQSTTKWTRGGAETTTRPGLSYSKSSVDGFVQCHGVAEARAKPLQ